VSARKPANAERIYCHYNKLLLKYHQEEEFPLLEFSVPDFLSQFERLCGNLELIPNIDAFVPGGKTAKKVADPWSLSTDPKVLWPSLEAKDIYEELIKRRTYK
jgi:hypothetical protein